MMNLISELNDKLLQQSFSEEEKLSVCLHKYRHIALMYSEVENSIAVLSNLQSNRSYIYYGGMAETLGLAKKGDTKVIDSIWEEEIFSKIHPDDLFEKHVQELRFFHFLKDLTVNERTDYQIMSRVRMANRNGEYISVLHRMFYVADTSNGSLWLALCLYNFAPGTPTNDISLNFIANSVNGNIINPDKQKCNDLLSEREKEILYLIAKGKISKEIAQFLSISINTVNRHRQNILEKLHVGNSIEACRVAQCLGLI